ncbi:MAG: RdgB/HAM1 family non-canonical purine NTP pyrophosphatase [Alphaproteobacteria bacterium]|nr:RdgB/HAM1 family non-canonical purine NTP pyrophosphatase [Alphaproteobacteria bacterium]
MSSAYRLKVGDKLVIATHNRGKIPEFAALLAPLALQLVSAGELGLPEPEETGDSFTANALLKARAAATAAGYVALADDSGLAVTTLAGAPGIYSARWAGPLKDFAVAMQRIETLLEGKTDRTAAFVSVLALCWPDGTERVFEGKVPGALVWPPRGDHGFGYDPMFVPDGENRTFAEMSAEQKNSLSHRARACVALLRATIDCVTLYRPTGPDEIKLLQASGFKRWPPRLPEQPIFYPVTNEDYACSIARDWNVHASGSGYVTRFFVKKSFMDNYPIKQVGGTAHTEWWIPAEAVEAMNDNIIGNIEIIREFR